MPKKAKYFSQKTQTIHDDEAVLVSKNEIIVGLLVMGGLLFLQQLSYYYIQQKYPYAFDKIPNLLQHLLVIISNVVMILSICAYGLLYATGGKMTSYMLRGFLWLPAINLVLILIPLLFAFNLSIKIDRFVAGYFPRLSISTIRTISSTTITLASWAISGPLGNAAYDLVIYISKKLNGKSS